MMQVQSDEVHLKKGVVKAQSCQMPNETVLHTSLPKEIL